MNGESIVNDEQEAQFQANIEMHDFSEGNVGAGGVERPEPAYFAKRPLKGYPWLGLLSNNSVDDQSNTELSHEHIFFEDEEGGDLGFFSTNGGEIKSDDPKLLKGYRKTELGYDDAIIRQAISEVEPKQYQLCGANQYNCQDWADDVRKKYYEIYEN